MNIRAEISQENKSRSAAASVAGKQNTTEQTLTFADNRPETVAQQKLQNLAMNSVNASHQISMKGQADNTNHATAAQTSTTANPIQRLVKVNLHTDEDTKKAITASGKVKDFKGGTSAGNYGWLGVTKYRSAFSVSDDKHENTGNVGPLQNDYTNPEAGHVLGKQNGGDGTDAWNVFAQDGGTNNSTYKIFENNMRGALNIYNDNDNVKFVSYLVGDEIEEGGNIAEAGLDDASSISSEDIEFD